MKILLSIILSLFIFIPELFSQEIYKKICITKSGKSIYEIALLAEIEGMGEIRLQFNGEDNLYSAKVLIINPENIVGVAKFKDSNTGQTKGSPWVFTYFFNTEKLIDDGRLEANCSDYDDNWKFKLYRTLKKVLLTSIMDNYQGFVNIVYIF